MVDAKRGALAMPEQGVMLSSLLARELGVGVGDTVEVEFRIWHRRHATLRVADVAHTMFGKQIFMDLEAMNRLARDGAGASDAALRLDPRAAEDFYAAVKQTPRIAAVFDKAGALRSFNETTARNLGFFSRILTVFAMAMAAGITYNAARIALSERAWELASLRVLGMTRAEVSVLLLAELALELLVALPLGCSVRLRSGVGADAADAVGKYRIPGRHRAVDLRRCRSVRARAGAASALVVRRQDR